MFKLSKKINGKWIVDSVDTLRVINRRKALLISSYRGKKVEFKVEPTNEDDIKYRKPLDSRNWAGGDYCRNKYKIKAKQKTAKRKNK